MYHCCRKGAAPSMLMMQQKKQFWPSVLIIAIRFIELATLNNKKSISFNNVHIYSVMIISSDKNELQILPDF
jgi:hypothetical protein